MLSQRRWRFEDLETGWAAMVVSFVGWRFQVGREGRRAGETLAVQALDILDEQRARGLTCT